ncbi:MAG: alpha/beta hydrolase [Spirochaetota bacterium]
MHRCYLPLLFLAALSATSMVAESIPVGVSAASELGRFDGELRIPASETVGESGAQVERISLRVSGEGYGLVDFPGRDIFGLPCLPLIIADGRFSFSIGTGGKVLRFDCEVRGPSTDRRIVGTISQGSLRGEFALSPAPAPSGYGDALGFAVPGGWIRGSLTLPEEGSRWPLVVLVSGPGSTDRDGNNYQVPGRTDSLGKLAAALAGSGVASFRYDKRGTGESLALAPDESSLRFDDYVTDLRAVIFALEKDGRFGRITVAGHAEGALVSAAALEGAGIAAPRPSLAIFAATGVTAHDIFSKSIESAPPELLDEGRAILASLDAGKPWPDPSPYYAEFFRPSFQAYLSSWLRFDLKAILPRVGGRILLVQGDRDIQESLEDFLSLAALLPSDPAVVIEAMNHVLKEVPSEVDANLAAFSDPSFPLPPTLVTCLAAFARGEELPAGLARVDGGLLPARGAPGEGRPEGKGSVEAGTTSNSVANSSQH